MQTGLSRTKWSSSCPQPFCTNTKWLSALSSLCMWSMFDICMTAIPESTESTLVLSSSTMLNSNKRCFQLASNHWLSQPDRWTRRLPQQILLWIWWHWDSCVEPPQGQNHPQPGHQNKFMPKFHAGFDRMIQSDRLNEEWHTEWTNTQMNKEINKSINERIHLQLSVQHLTGQINGVSQMSLWTLMLICLLQTTNFVHMGMAMFASELSQNTWYQQTKEDTVFRQKVACSSNALLYHTSMAKLWINTETYSWERLLGDKLQCTADSWLTENARAVCLQTAKTLLDCQS